MVEVDGGDLSDIYDQLNDEDEDSVAVAENISGRIDAVENLSDTLFDEWEAELSDSEPVRAIDYVHAKS